MGLAETLSACRLLFAVSAGEAAGLLRGLDAAGVKRAYRRAVHRTHPDLFGHLPESERARKADAFIQAGEAYRILTAFLERADRRPLPAAPAAHRAARPAPTGCRPLPSRPLRLGEFLVHRGIISPGELGRALAWQRQAVPRLGQIARSWRWLSGESIEEALGERAAGEPIGALLIRRGLLTPLQLRILLCHQARVRPPLGRYFLAQGLLGPERLERCLRLQASHNACCRLRRR